MGREIRPLAIFILLVFCKEVLSQLTTSVEMDGFEHDEGGGSNNKNKTQLMGLDYYNGSGGDGNVGVAAVTRDVYPDYDQLVLKKEQTESEEIGKNIVIMDSTDTRNYRAEMHAGNKADVLGTNPNYYQPNNYPDFGRRFVLQYPYTEREKKIKDEVKGDGLKPTLASPELVLAVAAKSALLDASAPKNLNDEILRKDILRTGDYWNGVWKEDADPKVLRSAIKLETINAEIPPGTKLYDLVSKLKQISPTLLYVINEKK